VIPPGPSLTDRLTSALAAFIDAQSAPRRFHGVYGFVVQAQTGSRVDCTVDDDATGLPSLVRVQLRPAIDGAMPQLQPGTAVLLMFVNGDPARPIIAGGDPNTAPLQVTFPAPMNIIGSGETEPLAHAPETIECIGILQVEVAAMSAAITALSQSSSNIMFSDGGTAAQGIASTAADAITAAASALTAPLGTMPTTQVVAA
jgi:hypothetical protein